MGWPHPKSQIQCGNIPAIVVANETTIPWENNWDAVLLTSLKRISTPIQITL